MSYPKEIKNVIVMMTDSLQYNYLGCYGNEWIKTPNYDRFAKQAALFENNFTEGLPTIPCRRAMFTGRYTLPAIGWAPLRPQDTTVADILWGSGVQTALVFDTAPMRLPKYGFARGFEYVKFFHGQELDTQHFENDECILDPDDYLEEHSAKGIETEIVESVKKEIKCLLAHRQHWRSEEDHQIARVTNGAIKYLKKEIDRSKPFFLWVDSFDPHEPVDPPSIWGYNDSDYLYNPGYKGKDQFVQIPGLVGDRFTDDEMHHIRMLYAEKVTLVDRFVGKLLDQIRELGLWDNTLIILVSDHGKPQGIGEHGHGLMRMFRPWPYEYMVHTPLLVRMPGQKQGKRIKAFTQSCDIAPTILDWLGLLHKGKEEREGFDLKNALTAQDMQGESVLSLITGENEKQREFAIGGYYGFAWSIITETHSYVHWLPNECTTTEQMLRQVYDGGGLTGGELTKDLQTDEMWTCTPHSKVDVPEKDELYDRLEDPFQQQNIIDKNPETAERLLKQLKLFIGELRMS
jgi:arylsulfatase A-like enzyme